MPNEEIQLSLKSINLKSVTLTSQMLDIIFPNLSMNVSICNKICKMTINMGRLIIMKSHQQTTRPKMMTHRFHRNIRMRKGILPYSIISWIQLIYINKCKQINHLLLMPKYKVRVPYLKIGFQNIIPRQ